MSWYTSVARLDHELKHPKVAGPPIQRTPKDSPHTATGWLDLGQEYFLDEDGVYPRNPEVTKALQVFDPGLIPMWVRWTFQSPSDTGNPQPVVFGRHAIGRWVPGRDDFKLAEVKIHRGNFKGPLPTIVERVVMGEADPRASDLPGAYKAWDWPLYYELRADFINDMSVKEQKEEFVRKPLERQKRRRAQVEADMEYRRQDLSKFVTKMLERVSEVEIRDHLMSRKLKALGR